MSECPECGHCFEPNVSDLEIGDEITVVVVHPNVDDSRDPVAKVGNKTTFIRFPNKENDHISFGDRLKVRIADIREENNLAVALSGYKRGEEEFSGAVKQ